MVDIVLRKRFDATKALLKRCFAEAGADPCISRITAVGGDDASKVAEIVRLERDLEKMDAALRAQAKGMYVNSSRDYDYLKVEMPGENPETRRAANEGNFKNLGHFVQMVVNEPKTLKAMGISEGPGGGYAIPDDFTQRILNIPPASSIVRPRAMVFPPGPYPDAKMEVPALVQGDSGILGGISFSAANEGTAGASVDPKLSLITLEPQRMSGYITIGNSLLRSDASMSAFLETIMRNAKAAWEDNMFIQGAGGALPLGMLNAPGAISVPRTTAATIVFSDVANMLSKQISNQPIWIASKSALGKLVSMADSMGNSIWIGGDIAKGLPPSLAGFPIFFTYRQPALGTKGDLLLVDPQFYAIKDGFGPTIAASEHILFKEGQTILRLEFWIDGTPWVKSPVVSEDGVTTVSPYVILS